MIHRLRANVYFTDDDFFCQWKVQTMIDNLILLFSFQVNIKAKKGANIQDFSIIRSLTATKYRSEFKDILWDCLCIFVNIFKFKSEQKKENKEKSVNYKLQQFSDLHMLRSTNK